jgi:hypothetical protein
MIVFEYKNTLWLFSFVNKLNILSMTSAARCWVIYGQVLQDSILIVADFGRYPKEIAQCSSYSCICCWWCAAQSGNVARSSSVLHCSNSLWSNSCRKGRVLFCHDNDGAFIKGLIGDWVSISVHIFWNRAVECAMWVFYKIFLSWGVWWVWSSLFSGLH